MPLAPIIIGTGAPLYVYVRDSSIRYWLWLWLVHKMSASLSPGLICAVSWLPSIITPFAGRVAAYVVPNTFHRAGHGIVVLD